MDEYLPLTYIITGGTLATSVIWLLSGNALRLLFHGPPEIIADVYGPKRRGLQVLLIHGTFAHNAEWTKYYNTFTETLRIAAGDAEIDRLVWSGDNSPYVRSEAACTARQWLDSRDATRPIVLIGHSHGGSIAAQAASSGAYNQVLVVTLATPFITTFPHIRGFLGPQGRTYARLAPFYGAVLAITIVIWFCIHICREALGIQVSELALAIPVLSLAAVGCIRAGIEVDLLREKAKALSNMLSISVPHENMLILRAPGDEASGTLALSQMAAWTGRTILLSIGRVVNVLSNAEQAVATARVPWSALFPIVLVSSWVAVGVGAIILLLSLFLFLLRTRVLSLLMEGTLIVLSLPLLFVAHLPFGFTLACASALLRISAEPSPMGVYRLHTVYEDFDANLAHSVLYDLPDTAYTIARWIVASNRANSNTSSNPTAP